MRRRTGGRSVGDELDVRDKPQVGTGADLVTDVGLRLVEGTHRFSRRSLVAEHAHEDPRQPEVAGGLDARHRREGDPRIAELFADERGELALQERIHPVRPLIGHP